MLCVGGSDLVYADDYTGDGLSSYYYPDVYQAGSTTPPLPVNTTSYQPRWDGWGRFMQTVGKSTSVRITSSLLSVFLSMLVLSGDAEGYKFR